jgi:hypothetical protein
MQVLPRGVAAITALLVLVGGLLAARHEAAVAHARDRAGGYVHARTLESTHTGHSSDIHGQRNPGAETSDCAVLTALHQVSSANVAAPAIAAIAHTYRDLPVPRALPAAAIADVYRLAPKTSPPAGNA